MLAAALELFAEQGFDKTTAGDIAARAGVTERTFFRHFADKREVLFDGSATLVEEVARAIGQAPADATPLEAALAGVRMAATILEDSVPEDMGVGTARERSAQRSRIVAETPALQERELLKMAALTAAAVEALAERGVPEPAASLAAHSATAVFQTGFGRWVSGEADEGLAECIDQAAAALRDLR